jgi:hypothetical protein
VNLLLGSRLSSFLRTVSGSLYLVVSLASGLTFTGGALIALTGYRSSLFRGEFISKIQDGQSDYADDILLAFNRALPFENLLYLPKELRKSTSKADISTLISDVLTTLQLIDREKFARSSDQFFGKADGSLRILLETVPKDQSREVSLEALRQQLLTISNAEVQLQGPLAKAEQQSERSLERYRQQAILLDDVVLETAELFTLKPEQFDSDDYAAKRFYDDGLLAGLPRLQGLSDNIGNPDELAKILNSIGGKVSLHGTNIPELFSLRIQELKASADVFRVTMEQLATSAHSADTALKETRRILAKNKVLARSNLVLLLEGLVSLPTAAEKNPYFLILEELAHRLSF